MCLYCTPRLFKGIMCIHAHTNTHMHMLDRVRQGCLVSFLLRNVFSGLLESSWAVIVELVLK